ncbi:MAG: type II toxin-antitoxin system RelE/ParE family toxin [Candidatus Omnitrophota bacterium]
MAYEIEWTENAREDLKRIIEYIRDEWSINVAEKFIDKVDSILEIISDSPYIGMASIKRKGVRQILITRHNRLFYRLMNNKIILLSFFDTRQDPGKSIY